MINESFFLEKDRIPVFIGKSGAQKKEFEEKFKVKINVNSNTGEVRVEGEDGLLIFVLSNVIHAINLGHSPANALKLEDESYVIDVLDVKDYVKTSERVRVVVGRIIGSEGSTRKTIEEMTKCCVSVRDSFVSFIGPYENIHIIKEAVEMLINGAAHKSLFNFLDRNKTKFDKGLM